MFDGFWSSGVVQNALLIGGAAAVLSGIIGVFTVLRGQSFAGHALADVSSAGGALSLLLGINPMLGFFGLGLLGAVGLAGKKRGDGDLAAGIVLGGGLGLTALLLHFAITMRGVSGAAVTVMFGSLFSAPPGAGALALVGALGGVLLLGFIHRPLLLASLDADLASVRGAKTRLVAGLYLVLLALSVTLSAMSVGAILSTALLIGPAAAALRLTRRPWAAMALAAVLGVACCWGGVALAYVSYGFTPGRVWPVSFFIVALVLLVYTAASMRRG
jgi:zinc/manganese transport system permease protein